MKEKLFITLIMSIMFIAGCAQKISNSPLSSPENTDNLKSNEIKPAGDNLNNWVNYNNNENNFTLKTPPSWKIIDTSKGANNNLIVMTKNHPLNKAGHIDVFEIPFEEFEKTYKKILDQNNENNIEESNINTDTLSGKHYKVVHKNGTQIDYVYDFKHGNKTLRITFYSYLNQGEERKIDDALKLNIDKFVNTVNTIK